jgi:hypothetical protein
MSTPRLYRFALRGYPAAYRAERAPELMATLAEGDEERGGPSLREAGSLVRRGIALRLRPLGVPDWLLVAAAVLMMLALVGGFTWAERVFVLRGEAAGFMMEGPGLWWALALGVCAYALAAMLFSVLASPRRIRVAAALAAPVALAIFTAPGAIFRAGVPGPAELLDWFVWMGEASFHNWTHTLPTTIAAVAGSRAALTVLARLGHETRRRALGTLLASLGALVVAQIWQRPDLPAEYGQSAFADLGAAAFIAALAIPLAFAVPCARAGALQPAAVVNTDASGN